MQPRSILKKRALPVAAESVEEVPASGPSADLGLQEPESETGTEDDDMDGDSDSFDDSEDDDEEDEEDEEAILEMGEARVKLPKSECRLARVPALSSKVN